MRIRTFAAAMLASLLSMHAAGQAPTRPAGDLSPSIELGRSLFSTYCASCHGTDGRGTGPMAGQLRHDVPDLTLFALRNGGMFPSVRVSRIIDGREVASHGSTEMPVWGDAFRKTPGGSTPEAIANRIAALTRYLEAIQQRNGE